VVSISGARGKKITGDQEWNRPDYRAARNNRSAVESLMFTLKDGYEFGQLLRRESENVRAELTEKVLAYNIGQIIGCGSGGLGRSGSNRWQPESRVDAPEIRKYRMIAPKIDQTPNPDSC